MPSPARSCPTGEFEFVPDWLEAIGPSAWGREAFRWDRSLRAGFRRRVAKLNVFLLDVCSLADTETHY